MPSIYRYLVKGAPYLLATSSPPLSTIIIMFCYRLFLNYAYIAEKSALFCCHIFIFFALYLVYSKKSTNFASEMVWHERKKCRGLHYTIG